MAVCEPSQRFTGGVKCGSFPRLFLVQPLAAETDAGFAQHGGYTGLGNAVASTDLLSGLADFIESGDVSDILLG